MITKAQIRKRLMESQKRDSQTKETIAQSTMNEAMDMIVDEVNEMFEQVFEQISDKQTNIGLVPMSGIREIFGKENNQ